jgi:hypothetical protein
MALLVIKLLMMQFCVVDAKISHIFWFYAVLPCQVQDMVFYDFLHIKFCYTKFQNYLRYLLYIQSFYITSVNI